MPGRTKTACERGAEAPFRADAPAGGRPIPTRGEPQAPTACAGPAMPAAGFEPATSALGKPCSIQLSYAGPHVHALVGFICGNPRGIPFWVSACVAFRVPSGAHRASDPRTGNMSVSPPIRCRAWPCSRVVGHSVFRGDADPTRVSHYRIGCRSVEANATGCDRSGRRIVETIAGIEPPAGGIAVCVVG